MSQPAKTILKLSANDALNVLMQSRQYCNFELPYCINFDKMLQWVRAKVGNTPTEECFARNIDCDDINYVMLTNKDGGYGVRPLSFTNPYLYYLLAREICAERNWGNIVIHFATCQCKNIHSYAIPVIPQQHEKFHNATAALNWWEKMEQHSIELSLEYRYQFNTDITNCYGSIDLNMLYKALAHYGAIRYNRRPEIMSFAQNVTRIISIMQQGSTVGIPQGSMVYDLIAEIMLSYADLLLYKRLLDKKIKDGYEILRYRDDYRIFCNDPHLLETISFELQHVLERLNMRLNTNKTHIGESNVTDSIKADKLDYIYNTPIFNKKGCDFDGFQKHLLYILLFGRHHRNAGQLRNMLTNLYKRLKEYLTSSNGHFGENVLATCSVATQIAAENPSATQHVLRIINKLAQTMSDDEERDNLVELVCLKLSKVPNNEYVVLWLQYFAYAQGLKISELDNKSALWDLLKLESYRLPWELRPIRPELTDGFTDQKIMKLDNSNKFEFTERGIYGEEIFEPGDDETDEDENDTPAEDTALADGKFSDRTVASMLHIPALPQKPKKSKRK